MMRNDRKKKTPTCTQKNETKNVKKSEKQVKTKKGKNIEVKTIQSKIHWLIVANEFYFISQMTLSTPKINKTQ